MVLEGSLVKFILTFFQLLGSIKTGFLQNLHLITLLQEQQAYHFPLMHQEVPIMPMLSRKLITKLRLSTAIQVLFLLQMEMIPTQQHKLLLLVLYLKKSNNISAKYVLGATISQLLHYLLLKV